MPRCKYGAKPKNFPGRRNERRLASAPKLYEALASLMTAVDYTRVLRGPKGAEIKERALAALRSARGEE